MTFLIMCHQVLDYNYADDALLFHEIKDYKDTLLQQDLNSLSYWATVWQMTFNPLKWEHLQITRKQQPVTSEYCSRYLGVIIDKNLNWNEHTVKIVNKANCVLGFLRRNLKQCSPHIKVLCYKSLVRPVLDYANVIWFLYHQQNIYKLEIIQKRAVRLVSNNCERLASVTEMLKDIGWPTINQRRDNLCLIFQDS